MLITNAEFIQGFIRLTDDAFKGWHERNGGNLSYRIKPKKIRRNKNHQHPPIGFQLV